MMKRCPFCAEEIQDAAVVCKHCGRDLRPQAAQGSQPAAAANGGCAPLVWTIAALVGVLVLASIFGAVTEQPATPPTAGSHAGAYDVCRQFVTERLRAPKTAEFPRFSDDKVSVQRENNSDVYAVRAYVDSQNAFGALIRSSFTCRVRWSEGTTYLLQNVKID